MEQLNKIAIEGIIKSIDLIKHSINIGYINNTNAENIIKEYGFQMSAEELILFMMKFTDILYYRYVQINEFIIAFHKMDIKYSSLLNDKISNIITAYNYIADPTLYECVAEKINTNPEFKSSLEFVKKMNSIYPYTIKLCNYTDLSIKRAKDKLKAIGIDLPDKFINDNLKPNNNKNSSDIIVSHTLKNNGTVCRKEIFNNKKVPTEFFDESLVIKKEHCLEASKIYLCFSDILHKHRTKEVVINAMLFNSNQIDDFVYNMKDEDVFNACKTIDLGILYEAYGGKSITPEDKVVRDRIICNKLTNKYLTDYEMRVMANPKNHLEDLINSVEWTHEAFRILLIYNEKANWVKIDNITMPVLKARMIHGRVHYVLEITDEEIFFIMYHFKTDSPSVSIFSTNNTGQCFKCKTDINYEIMCGHRLCKKCIIEQLKQVFEPCVCLQCNKKINRNDRHWNDQPDNMEE